MITEEEILKATHDISDKMISLSELERQIFQQLAYNGAKWAIGKTKADFLIFIESTGLSDKDKNLVKGVFYGWVKDKIK